MSEPTAPEGVLVRTAQQWQAVLSPVRLEMIETLRRHGLLSLAELAALLDRSADGLYHHVRRLVASGLVESTGVRKTDRRAEAVYALIGGDIRFNFDPSHPAGVRNFVKLIELFQRMGVRAFGESARAGALSSGPLNWSARAELAWLSQDEYSRLRDGMTKLFREIDESRDQREQGKGLYCMTFLATPVTHRRQARLGRRFALERKSGSVS